MLPRYAGLWVRERGKGRIELNRFKSNKLGPLKSPASEACEFVTRRNHGIISVIGPRYTEEEDAFTAGKNARRDRHLVTWD